MTQNNFRDLCFSKQTISNMSETIFQQNPNINLSRESKQKVIDVLVNKMKTIYKTIDQSKINNNNIGSIFEQYKQYTISETLNSLNNPSNNDGLGSSGSGGAGYNISDLKFQRDFKSNPNSGNKIMDRPMATKVNDPFTQNQIYNNQPQNNSQLNNTQLNNSQLNNSQFDQAFKPISLPSENNYSEMNYNAFSNQTNNAFNNQTINKSQTDIKHKLEEINKNRMSEVPSMVNKRPPTPDFLKPINTNPTKIENNNNYNNSNQFNNNNYNSNQYNNNNNNYNSNQDMHNNTIQDLNTSVTSFHGLSNDSGDDLYSLGNFDKPIFSNEIVEDNSSFEDRLKKLQSDRNNLGPIQQNQNDLNTLGIQQQQQQQPSLQQQQQLHMQQQPQQLQPSLHLQMQQQQQPQPPLQPSYPPQQLQPSYLQQQPQQQQPSYLQQPQQQQPSYLQQQPQQLQPSYLQHQQQPQQQQQLQIQQQQPSYLQQQQQQPSYLQQQQQQQQNNQLIQISPQQVQQQHFLIPSPSITNPLIKQTSPNQELNNLQNVNKEYELLKLKQEEINNKLLLLNNKEIEMKQLVNTYNSIIRLQHLQLEVSNESESEYTYTFGVPIKNVMSIKLISHTIPEPKYNIETNKNNLLLFKVNDTTHNIELNSGLYNIELLINEINRLLESNNLNISTKISLDQKIVFTSENNFDILPTSLLVNNLGFSNEEYSNNNEYKSNKVWDLRLDNKVYLYLDNLSDNPFGVLYFNNLSNTNLQFKFDKPFNLNKLDIKLLDTKGMKYNMNNLPHVLSFVLETYMN